MYSAGQRYPLERPNKPDPHGMDGAELRNQKKISNIGVYAEVWSRIE